MAATARPQKQRSVDISRNAELIHSPVEVLHQYCKDLKDWPDSWAGSNRDIPIGTALVEEFKVLLLDRIQKGRAKRTIKSYAGYLWALGGELIRQINYDDSKCTLSARKLILKYISEDGGPYWRHACDERDHNRYHSVCRQLYLQMTKHKPI